MNCDDTTGRLSDRLKGLLTAADEGRLDEHLRSCPACREEAAAVTLLWAELGEAEDGVPHERMRARFHAALAAYEERTRATGFARLIDLLWPAQAALRAGIAVALLVVGVVIGRGWPATGNEIQALRRDVRAMSLALLDHQSASERLLGIASSGRNAAYTPVADALLDVVRNDDNVNVRLAAVEALSEWLDRPEVGSALLEALTREDAPLMQVTLVDVLLGRRVDGAVMAIERLLGADALDPSVRDYARMKLVEYENAPRGNIL